MLFTSTPLLAELTDILGRRKFEKKIAASLMSVDQLVDRYSDLTLMVRPIAVTGVAPDPDDDVVIGTPKFDSWSWNSGQPQWCRLRKSMSYPAISAVLCCVTLRLLSS